MLGFSDPLDFGDISSCFDSGSFTGSYCIGGLVGYNSGTGHITTSDSSAAVTANGSVGGLIVAEDVQDTLGSSSSGLYIGVGKDYAGTFWSGLIDDVRIYSRAVRP